MDFVFESIFEVFINLYIELMTLFVPRKKVNKKNLKIIAAIEAVALFVAVIVGFCMIAESDGASVVGRVLLIAASAIIVLQIVFGLIIRKKKRKK